MTGLEERQVENKDICDIDQTIALMEIYLSEWEHRDELLWTQIFRFFYANLIVTVLPYIAEFLEIKLPPINSKLFPIIGMIMAVVFLYVGISYAIRLKASSDTYVKLMKKLGDEELERNSIKDKKKYKLGFIFSLPMAQVLVIAMFIALESIAIVLLCV